MNKSVPKNRNAPKSYYAMYGVHSDETRELIRRGQLATWARRRAALAALEKAEAKKAKAAKKK
jgi:hypothetical protein